MKLYRYILFSTLFLLCNTASKGQGGFNPPNPPEPNTQYQLSLQTYPNGAGSVYGNGKYNPGTNVSVYTYNGTGFKFKSWKEGDVVISTSSSFSYKTEARNVTLTAHFEYDPGNPAEPQTPVIPKKSKLFLETKPNDAGSFNISSGNTYTEGTEVYVYAHNNTGFVFEGWQDGETVLTTNRNYYYTVTDKDKTLTAVYNYNPGNPSEPNTPQDIEHSLIGLTQIGGIGQTIAYPIYLLNHNIEVKSAKFDVIFPEGAIVDYQNAVLSDRNNGHYMTVTQAAGNKYQANITSVADQAFFESNGILLTIPVTLPDSWTPGQTYPVVIENILLGTPAGEISSTAKNGALGLKESEGQKIYASFQPDQFLNRVLFTNLSSDNVIKYEWDFGDGSTSEEKNPFHIYTSEGNYEVKLTVSNVNSSDTAKLNIRVNAESSWRMWGTFSLNENKTGVRNFTSLEEFFTLMSKSAINGDITLQVQAGKIFELPLASTKEMLTLVKNKLQQSGYNLTFVKDGSGSNPVISVTGTPTPENILFVRDLSASWILDQVELLIFGIKINLSAIKNFTGQTVCSGTATEKVDLPLISNELSYEWAVVNPPANVTGYTNSGTGKMPAMTLTNNTSRPETLKYQVLAKSGAIVFYELEYPFIVNPVLSGQVTNLSPNGNEELYQTAVDLSWSTVENAVYDIYIWETGTEIPTVPYAAGVQTFRYTCSGFCQYGKNYSWKVIARNACTNIESSVAQFKLRSLPNLHVTEINCSDAYGGKIMTVSWKVKNDGSGTTGASQWIDRVWLIPDIYTGTTNSATLLKSVDFVSALVPGQSYENSTEVTIPDRLSGNYYIAVVSDMYDLLSIDWTPAGNSVVNPYTPNVSGTPYPYLKATTNVYYKKVEEEGETANVSDNFFYKQIDIQIPPLPDLQVVSVVPQDNSLSGQTIKVDAMITNDGDDDTPVGKSWASSIYISKDAEFVEANAIRLAYNYNGGYLKVGENTTVSFNAAIPIDWYGTVYFYVFVDCFDQIYEHAKDNNNITRSNPVNVILTPPADLKPTAISIPSVISAGAAFDLSVDIINAGAGSPNNAYWTDIIYLSKTNAGINQNAIEIARNNRNETLKPGSSYRISKSVQLPNLDEGVYYVYAHTNTGNSVFELEKDNNILCSANTVTVVKPDLVVEWGNLPEVLTSGKIQNISWVVKNIGEGEVKEKSITDYIYLSKSVDGSNPVRLAEHTYDMLLAEGKEQTNYLNVTVPYNQLLHGTCYIFVRTDYRNILQEKLKYNNSVTHEITYNYVSLPDLKISGLSHADRIVPGTTLQVSYKLSNVGSAHITNENYPVEIFISAYPQFDNRAVKCEIASQIQPATGSGKLIAAGAYTDFIQEVSIPSSVKGGTMYVHVVANRDKSLAVINTEVQSVYKYIFVAGNLPALSITSRMAPANVQSSEPFEVTWNVINTGESASPAFEDAVYISSGSTLGSEHERLIVTGSVTLPVGQPTNRTATVAIPDKWYGQKYLIIAADANNRVQEADRSDNIVAIPIEVALSPLPDLQVTSIEAENNAISGQTFKIKYKVSNQGESITRQDKWTDEFYLSLGTALDKNRDYFLGKKLRVGTLEVGSHYIDSVEVTIPTEVSGNYNLMVYADAGNVVFEKDKKDNNIGNKPLFTYRPSPCDLTVTNVTAPSSITTGQEIEVSWEIKNNSNYPMEGDLHDAIYFSEDAVWDISDYYISIVSGGITLDPGESVTRTMYGVINRVPAGRYYIIVRTNQQNNIIESSYDNNATAAMTLSEVIFEELGLNTTKQSNNKIKYYRIEVTDEMENQTLALNLTGQTGKKDIGLYVAHNKVPTVAEYDYSSTNPLTSEQEVIIPSLKKGDYYVMIQDKQEIVKVVTRYMRVPMIYEYYQTIDLRATSATVVYKMISKPDYNYFWGYGGFLPTPQYFTTIYKNDTPLDISSKILQFEIASISDNKGANVGSVTSAVSGAKFDSIMDFRLKNYEEFIPAEAVYHENQSAAWVTFNLKEAPTGSYHVEAELPGNLTTLKENGYSVVTGVASQLYTKIVIPSGIRIDTKVPFTIEFANSGNTDVKASELLLVSENGHPIGLSTQELDSMYTEVRVPISAAGNNSASHVIPPGTKGGKTVFVHADNLANIRLQLYIIRKDY